MRAILACVRRFQRNQKLGFGPITPAEREAYVRQAKRLTAEQGRLITAPAILSVHSQERALKACRRTRNPGRWRSKIQKARRQGRSIVQIAAQLDLPPNYISKVLRLTGAVAGSDVFKEVQDAANADANSASNQRRAQLFACIYEKEVGKALDERGLSYQTEEDLRRDGSHLTPDFLFYSPQSISGHQLSWLDAKNFLYFGNPLTRASLRRQARKYTQAFGDGAMIFAHGAAQRAPALGTLLLDPDWRPIV